MRNFALGLVVAAVCVSCSPPPCSMTCTTGCCDDKGMCQSGGAITACGTGGATCAACGADDVCSATQKCVPDAYADVSGFIADVVPAFCARAVRCKDANTQASCEDVLRNRYGGGFASSLEALYKDPAAAVKDSRATFDGAKGKKCIKAIRTGTCTDTTSGNPDCEATFIGKVADAQSCYFDGDCTPASYCNSTASTCPGTCQARKTAGTAAARDRECQDGLYLYAGKCLAYAATSSSCAPVSPSVTPQTCVETAFCNSSNICTARGPVNAACGTTGEQCQPSLTCSNGTCQLPGAVDATCNVSPNPVIPCEIDLHCDIPTAGSPGTCKVLGAVSTACWVTGDCATNLYCDGARLAPPAARGTCASRKAVTSACTNAGECVAGAYCSTMCTAQKMVNTSCTLIPADQCEPGLDCTGGTCKPNACHDPTP